MAFTGYFKKKEWFLWQIVYYSHFGYSLGLMLRYFKGYLRWKTIIFENVSSEAQAKDFLVLWKSYLPLSRYSSFFNHPMICQICDVMISISTWKRVHFWKYLLNRNSLTYQTWSIDRYKQGQYFSGTFWITWKTGAKFQVLFNLTTCSNY